MHKPSAALFVSFKTAQAIPSARPRRRDFLIQSTFDVGVRRIDFHPTVVVDDRVVRTDAIVVHRDDGRFVVDFVDARIPEDPQGEGLMHLGFALECSGILAVTTVDVLREPRLSAARSIWRHAWIPLAADDRAQVLDALEAEGPIPLRALDGLVATRRDPLMVVYALACEGSIALDLTSGLDGRTLVRGTGYGLCRRFGT
ncbi:hypothetical protein LPW26_14360 [Rhodopseudomonas sp. HC1]|uniref:hypothetical protein n=1 Tax=Rhodopseudomonas infernalis TaxID=2897386 RepID=UPI001EE7AC4E|nr:hypothetical protein [Rhodopseudomonas infernalis]MCG6205831.1 hypothetical protein [Rhodopseudomonas infernalis]